MNRYWSGHSFDDGQPLGMVAGIAVYSFIIIAGIVSLRTQMHSSAIVVDPALIHSYGIGGNVGLMALTILCVLAFAAPFLLGMLVAIPTWIVLLVMKHYHFHYHTISSGQTKAGDYSMLRPAST